jgi:hypothetical protein
LYKSIENEWCIILGPPTFLQFSSSGTKTAAFFCCPLLHRGYFFYTRLFPFSSNRTHECFLKYFFVANAFISPFNTQTMHIKSFHTQQHCCASLKTLYIVGIQTRVFSFLRPMRCPLRHAAARATHECLKKPKNISSRGRTV